MSSTYTHRLSALTKPVTYTLTETGLSWHEDGKEWPRSLAYGDIAEVNLAFSPSRVQRNRYFAHIRPVVGPLISISNEDYRGIMDFGSQDEAYSAFIRELHARMAAAGSEATFRKGSSGAANAGNWLLVALIVVGLLFAAWFLLTIGLVWIAVVKLAIIAFYIPTLIRYMKRSQPETYAPGDIPGDALPA